MNSDRLLGGAGAVAALAIAGLAWVVLSPRVIGKDCQALKNADIENLKAVEICNKIPGCNIEYNDVLSTLRQHQAAESCK